MQFALNGESRSLDHSPDRDGPLSVRSLLERFGLAGRRVAVAINAQVVPASRFDEVEVRPGDRVEVIQAVGGG